MSMLGGIGSFPLTLGNVSTYQEQFLAQIKAALGSLFTQENVSLVGAENIADAHTFAAVAHAADALTWQTVPATSSDSLLAWAERLGVPVRPTDTASAIREMCVAKYQAQGGNTLTNINDSVSEILKTALVKIHYFYGSTLSNEPYQTRWKAGTAGLAINDLGGMAGDPNPPQHANGAWHSVRCHLLIEAQQPNSLSFDEFLYVLNVRLFDLLDQMLPAYATFDWTLGPNWAGFIIGESQINYTAL